MYSIGEMISTKRKELNLSQIQLAELLKEKTGISVKHKAISSWERDIAEPSVSTFLALCKVLGITNIYETYYGTNPDNPLSSLNDEGVAKAMDYIDLLMSSGKYEKQKAIIIPFRREIDIYENAVSAGTGNFLFDGPKTTTVIEDEKLVPENADFGVMISGDSMEPSYHNGHIAWIVKQDSISDGDIGIFALNGEAYIKKLQDDSEGLYLISLNESYAPIKIGPDDRLDIFGKVVGQSNPKNIPGFSHTNTF